MDTNQKVKVCCGCEYWKEGVPCGTCTISETFLFTNDRMVFEDAGEECPLNNK